MHQFSHEVLLGVLMGLSVMWVSERLAPGRLRVDWRVVAKTGASLWGLLGLRLALSKLGLFPSPPDQAAMAELVPYRVLFSVWYEDALYVLPALVMKASSSSAAAGIFRRCWLTCSAVVFGLGHSYQGALAVAMAMAYIPFVSYRYGKSHGLGTVMALHVAWDIGVLTYWRLASGWN
ncbi:MAG: hypothetical protein IT285_16210 [Bdellovibrionales bacterium]|nr:hypothetical protein [Bdellovibrionales bacterium]